MTPQRDVPREPTQAMIDAATTMHTEMIVHCRSGPDYPDIWRAMYDAAPAAAPAAPAPDADTPRRFDCFTREDGVYESATGDHVEWSAYETLRATVEQQARELAQWRTWGIAEIAIRNPSVMEYMKHWEGRADRAERDLSAARAAIAAADAMRREGSDGYNDGQVHLAPHLRLTLPTDDPYILAIREYDRLRAAMGDGNG